jgi:mannose-6-phosphate isomerase-like protein (cupin superfamily)
VIAGERAFISAARRLGAPAGAWLQVPAGVPYALRSAGAEPVRYLDLRAPGSGLSEPPP